MTNQERGVIVVRGDVEFLAISGDAEPDEHPLQPLVDRLKLMGNASEAVARRGAVDNDRRWVESVDELTTQLRAAETSYRKIAAMEVERCTCDRCAARPTLH